METHAYAHIGIYMHARTLVVFATTLFPPTIFNSESKPGDDPNVALILSSLKVLEDGVVCWPSARPTQQERNRTERIIIP